MSIILITGATGSGKTALGVDWLAFDPQYQKRPRFVGGIKELTPPHEPVWPVSDWTEMRPAETDPTKMLPHFRFPPESVIWLDEAQQWFRPRPVGSPVPPEVAAFETHRHGGVDFILMTQHPSFIDSHVRKLVKRHIHVWTNALGNELLEWEGRVGDVDSRSDRDLAQRTKYSPPKRVFGLYKSAEVHTKIKGKIPKALFVVIAAAISFVGLGVYSMLRVKAHVDAVPEKQVQHSGGPVSAHASPGSKSVPEYLSEREPRISGMPSSAPMYDEVTRPREAPYPVGCVASATKCKCIDQQGNTYWLGIDQCRSFVADGMFIPWRQQQPLMQAGSQAGQGAPVAPLVPTTPGQAS